jgi:hypothetical protein
MERDNWRNSRSLKHPRGIKDRTVPSQSDNKVDYSRVSRAVIGRPEMNFLLVVRLVCDQLVVAEIRIIPEDLVNISNYGY